MGWEVWTPSNILIEKVWIGLSNEIQTLPTHPIQKVYMAIYVWWERYTIPQVYETTTGNVTFTKDLHILQECSHKLTAS